MEAAVFLRTSGHCCQCLGTGVLGAAFATERAKVALAAAVCGWLDLEHC